ncbi:MAG: hypothetical protein MI748_14430 [Opitutales bacterium]|nr:hypothetical protein [Opitutales bacterium]
MKILISLLLVLGSLSIFIFVLTRGRSSYKKYLQLKRRCQSDLIKSAEEGIIQEADLSDLPAPVKKYLHYSGVVGTPKVRSFKPVFEGQMKMGPDKEWCDVQIQQINYIEEPTRLFYITLKHKGIPVFGLHHYEQANATMKIRILDLITVVDAKGEEMNQGETVTFFNDMCLFAPGSLMDPRISWEAIDDYKCKGIFRNGGIEVSAILHFNKAGELTNFVSEDRYYSASGGGYENYPWSTPVGNYQKIGDYQLATQGQAVWHMKDGDFIYIKLNIKDVIINP